MLLMLALGVVFSIYIIRFTGILSFFLLIRLCERLSYSCLILPKSVTSKASYVSKIVLSHFVYFHLFFFRSFNSGGSCGHCQGANNGVLTELLADSGIIPLLVAIYLVYLHFVLYLVFLFLAVVTMPKWGYWHCCTS